MLQEDQRDKNNKPRKRKKRLLPESYHKIINIIYYLPFYVKYRQIQIQ